MTGATNQFISVDPPELKFRFELEKQSYCDLKVANTTDQHVAFKVKTTSPKKYFVRPNTGVIQPWDSCIIRVTLQAQRENPPDMQCKDKFLLQTTNVPPHIDVDELPQDTFNKEGGKMVEECKLKVVYILPQTGLANEEDGFKNSDTSTMRSSVTNDDNQVLERLRDERDAAVQQTQQLQRELEMLKRKRNRKSDPGFSFRFALFVALIGIMGVVHRDVKPGNFLFSRKLNKGYLIDFNLAMDLHQKYGTTDKSAMSYDMVFNHAPVSHPKSLPPAKSRKFLTAKALEAINQEAGKGSKSLSLSKNLKMKTNQAKEDANLSTRNIIKSQGADGSGITSAKDATSTRIPSAERLREPMPCQGRKELISLAQEAMKSPNHEVASSPASKRKRISALPEGLNRKPVYLTPMPLHSTGVAVAGAGLLKSKGESKHKREGPCVGTKGFRAPESLFRSIYQGPKVDIWSAGVTLLFLITGRSPFVGDPDQNIKDIAKFRGSEDLWEVAKLHNRESSFPVQLFDKQHLPSKKLRDWCGLNTRRSDFLEVVPRSFFDLLDKCLTVNPRLRISAEEALRHEFFAPCHEQLRKHRLLRQGLSCATLLLNTQPQICQGL